MGVRAWTTVGAMAAAVTMGLPGIAQAAPATTMPGDGLYFVGVDIAPGWYESPGTPDDAYGCDYRRLWKVEGDNTDMRYIIANDFTRIHPVRAQIEDGDVAFKTENCGAWRKVSSPPPPLPFG